MVWPQSLLDYFLTIASAVQLDVFSFPGKLAVFSRSCTSSRQYSALICSRHVSLGGLTNKIQTNVGWLGTQGFRVSLTS